MAVENIFSSRDEYDTRIKWKGRCRTCMFLEFGNTKKKEGKIRQMYPLAFEAFYLLSLFLTQIFCCSFLFRLGEDIPKPKAT